MEPKFFDIITDCALDTNGQNRLWLRANQLYSNIAINVVGVRHPLQAAGNLIDALDQVQGNPGIILVNVAPRHGEGKRWPNGTPFGYFWMGKTLVVSTIAGETLSLAAKLGIASEVHVLDIPAVMKWAVAEGHMTTEEADSIIKTQFRSLTFQPLVSSWIAKGFEVPATVEKIADVAAPIEHPTIWWVDNFGNCKTTVTDSEPKTGMLAGTRAFDRLRDVPEDSEPAVIVGSSGFEGKRFYEIVVQGKSAAEKLDLAVGSVLS
jgi:hypothetical protein